MIKRIQLPSGAIEYVDSKYKPPGQVKLKVRQTSNTIKKSISSIWKKIKS